MTHSSSRSPSALRSRFRPLLEGLEDRTVPTILVVDPAGGPGIFTTIQAAVNAANPAGGDTIQIHPATYAEQVTINKSLTMLGTAPGVTIKAPATLTPDPVFALRVLVEVDNAAVVDLSSLTISGPAPLINAGLLIVGGATANVTGITVTQIQDPATFGNQRGFGIQIGGTGTQAVGQVGHATITGCTVTAFQKVGIIVGRSGSTGTIKGTTITGVGPTPQIAQNGMQIGPGSGTATVSNTTISGLHYTGTQIAQSFGILNYIDTSSITGNTIFDNDGGIFSTNPGSTGPTISGNTVRDNPIENILLRSGTATVTGNTIRGSSIGVALQAVAALGLRGEAPDDPGVPFVAGAAGNTVGGTTPGTGNVITANTTGVVVGFSPADTTTVGNRILGNRIFGNTGLGIDLGNDGVTPNDPADPDPGPNHLQNFPTLNLVTGSGTSRTATGTLDSNPGRPFRIEFFLNAAPDPSGSGEGEVFVGSVDVTTDPAGLAPFSFNYTADPARPFLTATATDLTTGDTSEFSNAVTGGPPVVTPPADQTATAGVAGSFPLGKFADPGIPGPWTVTVDWGDKSPHETFTVTAPGNIGSRPHTFAAPDVFTVSVTVSNGVGGVGSAAFAVDVAPAPVPPGQGRPVVVGAGVGGAPHVKLFNPDGLLRLSFFAYDSSFRGGVTVALGDVNGDGTLDVVTGAGLGGAPHVKAFDGKTGAQIASFFAYDSSFRGGVFVAAADVNDDGFADFITGAGVGGGPNVKVFSGKTGALIQSYFAYDSSFRGGVTVAGADINGDRRAEVITGAGPLANTQVKVFDGATGAQLASFFAYDPSFSGRAFVGAGDVDNNGFADIVTGAGLGGGPNVKAFDDSLTPLRSFFAYDPSFRGGVTVAAGDVTGDGRNDLITGAGFGGGPNVKVFDGVSGAQIASFFAYDPSFRGGVFVG